MSYSPGPVLLFKGPELQILWIKDLPVPWDPALLPSWDPLMDLA